MNILEAFGTYMVEQGYGTLGAGIYFGAAPLNAPDACWWLVMSGGNNVIKAHTGEKLKNYLISAYYRGTDAQDVYDTMQAFEELVNGDQCIELSGYDIIESESVLYPSDQDLDNEDRTVGLMQISLKVYTN